MGIRVRNREYHATQAFAHVAAAVKTAFLTMATLLLCMLPIQSRASGISDVCNDENACDSACSRVEACEHPVFALRTNLLMPLLNVGVEVPVSEHWSVGVDYYYPWLWRNGEHKNAFQLAFVSGEARYWFGSGNLKTSNSRRLLGHSVAAYGAWGYYDFEHDWSGHQGHFTSFGADYLYAVPVFKGRAHIEFQLAVGYIHSKAQPYDVHYEGANLIRRKDMHKNFNYVGPTKAAVSLVLPIIAGKGGRR